MRKNLLTILYYLLTAALQVNPCLNSGKLNTKIRGRLYDKNFVKAGDEINIPGSNGLNAYIKRLPAYLHLLYLQIENGYLTLKNIYRETLTA